MLFLGFSAGIPILLIFSSLSLWLTEAGVEKSSITFFSWAALGYSFKFVWAPLVDKLPIPILTAALGRRRGWLLVSQIAIITSIVWMACSNPQEGLFVMALAAVILGFSSATQDVVIDAFRIESADPRLQAMLSSTYIAGYRTGMIVAGAGGAAHLPGMIAAISALPVVAVPVKSKFMDGMDSLLSIAQMPRGVAVATQGVGEMGAYNAGVYAAQILATSDQDLFERFKSWRLSIRSTVGWEVE